MEVESRIRNYARSRSATLSATLSAAAALVVLALAGIPPAAAQTPTECRIREVAKRVASDADAGDKLGWSSALEGTTAIVGSISDDDQATNAGAAYVFLRGGSGATAWSEAAKLTAFDGAESDEFGFAVALSGDLAVVTARRDDEGAEDAGSAYLFERDAGGVENWGFVKKLPAPEPSTRAYFGWSVAAQGDTVVVGAMFASSMTGAAYIYERDEGGPNQWGLAKKLTASDAASEDRFGRAVWLEGDTLLVTADGNDDEGSSSGSAYVFERNSGGANTWGQVKKLTASDPFAVDHFGISGAVSGDTIVIGAHLDDDNGGESGSAYVFERDAGGAGNWGEVKKLTASDGAPADSFGRAVAIDADTIVATAYAHGSVGLRSGAAYVFQRDRGGLENWGELKKITASAAKTLDDFGWHASISGVDMVIGAPHPNQTPTSDPGAAYFYECFRRARVITQPPAPARPFSIPRVASPVSGERLRSLAKPRVGRPAVLELDCRGFEPGVAALLLRDWRGSIVARLERAHRGDVVRYELPEASSKALRALGLSLQGLIADAHGMGQSNSISFDFH